MTATAAVVTEQYGKIMLTTGAAEEKTYTLGNQYLFQMFAPAHGISEGGARRLEDQGSESGRRLRL